MKHSFFAYIGKVAAAALKQSALCLLPLLLLGAPILAEEPVLPFTLSRSPEALPKYAQIETTQGKFEIEFFREIAPVTVRSFEYLGRKGFYKGLPFHRHVPGFIVQGGDPLGTGKGGPGYTLPPEHSSEVKHLKGSLGMARLPSEVNPERRSNGSQFYICFSKAQHLDGLYTVFARVVDGMENAEKLRAGDKILSVKFPK